MGISSSSDIGFSGSSTKNGSGTSGSTRGGGGLVNMGSSDDGISPGYDGSGSRSLGRGIGDGDG